MGVAAASNTFNVFNTGRLLLKVAKNVQSAACYSAEFANSLIIMAAAGFYTGSRPSGILQNEHLMIKKFDPLFFNEGRGHK